MVFGTHRPERLVNYVARTRQSVVLDDAIRDETYGEYSFIAERRPLSALCMPLLDRGELVGLLYAENSLTRGAFSADRVHTLQLLASQAAISLENARLYQDILLARQRARSQSEGAHARA